MQPQFPDGTERLSEVRSTFSRGVTVQRWRIRVPDGLDGKAIVFSHLSETRIDVLARLVRLDGTVQLERILPVSPSFVGRPSPGPLEVVSTYTILGIEHILSGFDHLLFVLALVLLVQGTRRLLVTITAFTAAHSLTLAGATLGWVHVPGPPVEASIALSIVFVASEIVHTRQGRYSVTQHYPWVVAFTFGLLHGFGFAGALAEVGLPQSSIPIALLFFNVGVEIGQLLFVGAVLAVIAPWLARGTPASIVATGLALAHRAVCHRCARELLAGRTSRRVLTARGEMELNMYRTVPTVIALALSFLAADRQTGVRSDDGEGSGREPYRQSRKRRGRVQELSGEAGRQRARRLVHGPGVRAQEAAGHRKSEGQCQQQEGRAGRCARRLEPIDQPVAAKV